jgi:outer membrane protein
MKRYLAIILLLLSYAASAQQRLTLQDAIARTLKYNFDISIADLSAEQAARNNTIGNAGFLPNISLGSSAIGTLNNVQSRLVSGAEQNNANARSFNYSPGLTVNWTIFDGGKMFIVKKQLNKLESLGDVLLKAQVQAMVSRTIQMYAQVVYRLGQVVAIDTALQLAATRMAIARLKYETGAGAKIDYLQAQVDFNASRSDSLTFISTFVQANDSLAVLMGDNQDHDYIVDDSLVLNTHLRPIDKQQLEDVNLSISSYRYSAEVSKLNADIAKTYFLPTIAFNGGVAYSHSTNSTGFSTFNQTYGSNYGLSLSMPLYLGGNVRRQAKVASLQAMKDQLLYERQNTVVAKQYRRAWKTYEINVREYNLERETIKIAQENVEVQQARFRIGVGTTLESKTAENDYVTALERLYTAAYNLKLAETILLELQDELVTTAQ